MIVGLWLLVGVGFGFLRFAACGCLRWRRFVDCMRIGLLVGWRAFHADIFLGLGMDWRCR